MGGAIADPGENVDARTPLGCRPPTPLCASPLRPHRSWGRTAGEEYPTQRPRRPALRDRRSLRVQPCSEYPPGTAQSRARAPSVEDHAAGDALRSRAFSGSRGLCERRRTGRVPFCKGWEQCLADSEQSSMCCSCNCGYLGCSDFSFRANLFSLVACALHPSPLFPLYSPLNPVPSALGLMMAQEPKLTASDPLRATRVTFGECK